GTAISMKNSLSLCGPTVVTLFVVALLLPPVCFAQEPAGGQAPPAAPPTGAPAGQPADGRQRPGNTFPGNDGTPQQRTFPDLEQRPIYLSGSVRLADGTIPPDRVVIERVCKGVVRPEAYTDSKGNFSFQLGARNTGVFYDASVGGIDPLSSSIDAGGIGPQRGINESDLSGCEIRANLAGFQSDSIVLGFRRSLDDPDIGTIRLRRLANVEGYTFSVTTAQAPKDARKAYEKGLELLNKRKWEE